MLVNGFTRRSWCVITAVPLLLSVGVSTASADSRPHRASIKMTKSVHPDEYRRLGQRLHFHYKVTNNGTEALDRVEVIDNKHGLSRVHCPHTDLFPGRSMTCHATYRITKRDLKRKFVKNCAFVHARDPKTGREVRSHRVCARAFRVMPVTG